ncbi:MAG: stalk domain-containing protein [Tissierellia bacterium]|nr:stalk domain-containing protein [Tissierellia bacterium]
MKAIKRSLALALALVMVLGMVPWGLSPVFAEGEVAINDTNFPDATFRQYISDNFDTDEPKDGSLSQEELDAVTKIDVEKKEITDLKGLEHFKNLKKLDCFGNALSQIDLSQNTALEYLQCGKNQLKTLDLRNNTKLQKLYCYKNNLTSLDLSQNNLIGESDDPFFDNFNLKYQTYAIEVVNNTLYFDLTSLPGNFDPSKTRYWDGGRVVGNTLIVDDDKPAKVTYDYEASEGKELDVTLNITYKDPTINNPVTVSFDFGDGSGDIGNIRLEQGSTYILPLFTFTAPDNKEFKAWEVDGQEKKPDDRIVVNEDITIKALWKEVEGVLINEENFPDDNFRAFVDKYYNDDNNNLLSPQELDISKMKAYDENIEDLTGIEHFSKLKDLNCVNNQLTSLDLSKNTALTILSCDKNQLTSLDLSGNPDLEELFCGENALTSLNISQNSKLNTLWCYYNELTELDLSGNPALMHLHCVINQLTSLDTRHNPDLVEISCGGNQLRSLNISQNSKLETFECYTNQLTSLDLSGNPALTNFSCSENNLTSLDLSGNPNLSSFDGFSQTYEIGVDKSTRKFDLNLLPRGFDPAKASDWVGGSVSGNILTINADEPEEVTYNYAVGQEDPLEVALKVSYLENPVTLRFDGNGGTGSMGAKVLEKGSSYTLPENGFTAPEGKVFKAWSLGGQEKAPGAEVTITADTTLKALWAPLDGGNSGGGGGSNTLGHKPSPEEPEKPIEKAKAEVRLTIGSPLLETDQDGTKTTSTMDVAPYIKDGRTMLPVRYVAQALGFEVDWNEASRTVLLKGDGRQVQIPVDTNKIIVDGVTYESDVQPEIKDGRTFLPLRVIAEALDFEVVWDPATKTVTLKEEDYRAKIPVDTNKITVGGLVYESDVQPEIKDGRTLLPLRALAQALGFEVEWDEATRTVVLKAQGYRAEIPVDSKTFVVNGVTHESDVQPEIKDGRTMLPLRAISQALGFEVQWQETTRTVLLKDKK